MKVARLHYRISCTRKDTLHKLTTFLAHNYSQIAIENLNVKGMVKNHKLARAIQDIGFGEFSRQIEYKTKWRSSELIEADRFFPSSKTCNKCKLVKETLLLKEREFVCECGNKIDRDFNAALNLKDLITDDFNFLVGRVPAEFTPVEITAIRRAVHPIVVTSIGESGRKRQIAA